MYTGALENRPQLVAQISRQVALLGNPRSVLRRVRDPQAVAAALRVADLPYAEVIVQPDARLTRGRWLCKPRASAAGRGIRFVSSSDPPQAVRSLYFQRYVPGQPCAGVFLAAAGSSRLLGVTRQLVGEECLGAQAFQYAGSIGPLDLTASQRHQWQQLGDCFSAGFGLRGLFGVDAIDTGQAIVPVEVNPRYTASIEVLERSLRWPIVAWHVQACRAARLPELPLTKSTTYSGKAIVYAVTRCRWTGEAAALRAVGEAEDTWPPWADIPPQDACFERGWPILSVLAQDSALPQVRARLSEQVAQARSALAFPLVNGS